LPRDVLHPRLPIALQKQVDARRRHGAGERVGHERGLVHKTAGAAPGDRLRDLGGGEGGGERKITAGQRLAQAQDVRGDARVLAGGKFSGAPEAGGDLIGDEQHRVRIATGRRRSSTATRCSRARSAATACTYRATGSCNWQSVRACRCARHPATTPGIWRMPPPSASISRCCRRYCPRQAIRASQAWARRTSPSWCAVIRCRCTPWAA